MSQEKEYQNRNRNNHGSEQQKNQQKNRQRNGQNQYSERRSDKKNKYTDYSDRLGIEPHYVQWGITAFTVIAGSTLCAYLIFNFGKIVGIFGDLIHNMRSIIYGMVLAYLMTPIVNGLERKILRPLWTKMNKDNEDPKAKKTQRAISVIVTITMVIGLLYLFFASIIPQLVQSITNLVAQFPTYTENLQEYINKVLMRNPNLQKTVSTLLNTYNNELEDILTTKLLPKLNSTISKASANLLNSVFAVISTLWNLIIGLIVSVYLLASKEHFAAQAKKLIYAVTDRKRANGIIKNVIFVKHTFGDYLSGKVADSLVIGLICFIGMTCMQMPYTLLISVIVGVTNIIPFFGPYLGAIPSVILILMVDPKKALIFAIFILLLQQFDGNFLGPKILGDSTGLSSFWIIFSITLFGGYFGLIGMAIGVPVFAILYATVRYFIQRSLKEKSLSIYTKDYLNLSHIDAEKQYLTHDQVKKAETKRKDKNKTFSKSHSKNDPSKEIMDEQNNDPNHNESK